MRRWGHPAGRSPADGAPGKLILPDGCKNLDEAADHFLAELAPEDLLAFDQSLQKDITRKFRGLGNVCLKPLTKGPVFRELLLAKARDFLDAKLDHSDPAAVFFRSQDGERDRPTATGRSIRGSGTGVGRRRSTRGPTKWSYSASRPVADGDRLKEMAKAVLPETEFVAAPLPDDICFYREYPQLALADLPQLGEYAREAYRQAAASGVAPHARADVPWQPPGT